MAAGFAREMDHLSSQPVAGTPAPTAGEAQVISMDFREVLMGMWRRRLAIVLSGVVFALVAYGMASMSTPRYTTSAQVLVDNLETPFNRAQPNEGASGIRRLDPADVQSQVEVLQSRDIAKQVVAELSLTNNPEFNPPANKMGPIHRVKVALGFSVDPRLQSPEQRALAAYYKKVDAYQIPSSKVIVIEASSGDPRMAAALANVTAKTYVEETRKVQSAATHRARKWLSEEIDTLRKKVTDSEAAVEAFRTKAGLIKGQGATTLNAQQLSELNTQIILAESQRSEARAKANAIRDLLKRTGTVDTSIDVLNSPLIQRLREQQITLKRTLADLKTVYLANHPKIIAAKSQLADLDRQLRAEALKVAQSQEQQAKIAAAREDALRASLNRLKSQASVDNQDEVKLHALEREAVANRNLLETFLARYSDASARLQLDAQPGLARIIARADPPAEPSYPKLGPIVLIGLVGGLLLGLGFAFMAEVMGAANRIFDPARRAVADPLPAPQVPVHADAVRDDDPAVAETPMAPADGPRLSGVAVTAQELTAERARSARDAALAPVAAWLVSQHATLGVRRFALVSHGGTGSVAADAVMHLMRLAAADGLKLIVVDADARRHPLGRLFGLASAQGLGELLTGGAAFADVIVRDPHSSAHVLPWGQADAGALTPSSRLRMNTVLGALEGAYDVVLVHVGPVAADELAAGSLVSACKGAILFAPTEHGAEAAVILEHLHRLGARSTRLVRVGGASSPRSDKAASARMAVNA